MKISMLPLAPLFALLLLSYNKEITLAYKGYEGISNLSHTALLESNPSYTGKTFQYLYSTTVKVSTYEQGTIKGFMLSNL